MAGTTVLTRFTGPTVSGLARMGDFVAFSVKTLRALPPCVGIPANT